MSISTVASSDLMLLSLGCQLDVDFGCQALNLTDVKVSSISSRCKSISSALGSDPGKSLIIEVTNGDGSHAPSLNVKVCMSLQKT